eukprot:g57442.t1
MIFQPFSVHSTPFCEKKKAWLANGLMPPRKQTRSKGWRPHSKGKQKKATSATSKRHSRREKEVEKQTKRAKIAHEKAEKREAEEREIEEQETIEAEDKGASKGNVFYEFDGSQHRLIAESEIVKATMSAIRTSPVRKELTKEVNLKYDLKVSADGLSASASVYTILTELEAKWCGEELEELKQSADDRADLEANYRVKELQFRGYKKKDYKFRCSICANYYVYKKPFQKHEEECRAAAEVDLDLVIVDAEASET